MRAGSGWPMIRRTAAVSATTAAPGCSRWSRPPPGMRSSATLLRSRPGRPPTRSPTDSNASPPAGRSRRRRSAAPTTQRRRSRRRRRQCRAAGHGSRRRQERHWPVEARGTPRAGTTRRRRRRRSHLLPARTARHRSSPARDQAGRWRSRRPRATSRPTPPRPRRPALRLRRAQATPRCYAHWWPPWSYVQRRDWEPTGPRALRRFATGAAAILLTRIKLLAGDLLHLVHIAQNAAKLVAERDPPLVQVGRGRQKILVGDHLARRGE